MPNLYKLADARPQLQYQIAELSHSRTYLSTRDPKTREKILHSYQDEDKVYGLVYSWYGTEDEAEKSLLRGKITEGARKIVEDLLDERQQGIEKLEAQIEDQKNKLAQDRQNEDQLVDDRVSKRFLNESPTTKPSNDDSQQQSPIPPTNTGALASPHKP